MYVVVVEDFGIDVGQIDMYMVSGAGVNERFDDRLVGIWEFGVLADESYLTVLS